MKHIQIGLFISFALGIIIGKFLTLNFSFLLVLSCLLLVLAFIFYKKNKQPFFDVCILLFLCFLGFIWIKPYTESIPNHFLGQRVRVCGKVSSLARQNSKFNQYVLRDNYILYKDKKVYIPATILVKDYSKKPLTFADYYLFKGKIKKSFYNRYKYILYLKKNDPAWLVKETFDIRKGAFQVSKGLDDFFQSRFSPLVASFLSSIFLGRREELPFYVKDDFAKGGTSHLLAISGLHVGVIIWILLLVLKMFNIKRKRRLIISMVLILIYAFVCGLKPPILRAVVMFWCFGLSFFFNRKFLVFNALGLAGLVNLIWRPSNIFGISFQFSFIAVLFIATGVRYFYPGHLSGANILTYIKGLFFVSLFANLGLMPLVSYYFGRIYVLNLITNIVLIPYLGALLASISVLSGMYMFVPLREVLINGVSFLVVSFVKLNSYFAGLPFNYFEYRFSVFGVYVYYFIIIAVILVRIKYKRLAQQKNILIEGI